MKRATKKALVILASVLVLLSAAGWRALREYTPAGVRWVPYHWFSYDRGVFPSPDGRYRLLVRTNDPGAAGRNANCWTWVMTKHRLWGMRVVAEGYLPWEPAPPANDQIPIRWVGNSAFTITFVDGPNDGARPRTVRVDLDR